MGLPTEERFVAAAEHALGVAFPAALRERLLRTNGGAIELDGESWWLHPVRDDRSPKHVARSCNDVMRETGLARTWPRFPATAVAIASDETRDHRVRGSMRT